MAGSEIFLRPPSAVARRGLSTSLSSSDDAGGDDAIVRDTLMSDAGFTQEGAQGASLVVKWQLKGIDWRVRSFVTVRPTVCSSTSRGKGLIDPDY